MPATAALATSLLEQPEPREVVGHPLHGIVDDIAALAPGANRAAWRAKYLSLRKPSTKRLPTAVKRPSICFRSSASRDCG